MDQDVKKDKSESTVPFDVKAVNPRYKGAWMSDVARALIRPTNQKVAAVIEARREEFDGE